MYVRRKMFSVLENAAGFLRLGAYIYGSVINGSIGVCLYSTEANFTLP